MAHFERATLAVLVGAAVLAFTRALLPASPWLVLAAVSLVWRRPAVPRAVVDSGRHAVRVLGAVVLLLGWTLMAYPVLSTDREALVTLVCGYPLALLSTAFLLSPAFPRASTLYPAVAALLALACFDPTAHVRVAVAVAGLALVLHLAAAPARRWTARHAGLLAVSAIVAFVVARWIVGFLPAAQTRVEEVGFGMMGAGGAPMSGMSAQVRLGELSKLKLSSAVVLRVFGPAAQKLRGRVYTAFDGRSWRGGSSGATPLATLPPEALAGAGLASWSESIPGRIFGAGGAPPPAGAVIPSRILQRLVTPGLMVAPGGVRLVRAPLDDLRLDGFGLLRPAASAEVEVYGVVSQIADDVTVPGQVAEPLLAACLEVPGDTDERLRELAGRLAAGLETPRQKIDRTVNYVAAACHYSLEPGAFHTRQPLAEFLFEKKRGYCEYFASSAALLLRLQGVPARYVTGFGVGEGNRAGGHYVVRESDAHAWIEAYVPERGWVEADPTPAAEYAALHPPNEDVVDAGLEWLKGQWAAFWVALRFGDWRGRATLLGGALALAVVVLAARVWLRRRRAGGKPPTPRDVDPVSVRPEVRQLLAQADRLWARAGHARPASRAPLEHALSLPAERVPLELRDASLRIVQYYYQERFGGRPAPAEAIADLASRLKL
jgi:transglutaminase-like putative cysteine protease